MTVFNTIVKVGRRFASELENLKLYLLEQSKIIDDINLSSQLVNKGRYNTVTKLKRRKINELQGLKMNIVQLSFREKNATIDMLNECVDTTNFNTFDKISRRKYGEIGGLLVNIIENSNRVKKVIFTGLKLVKPIKKYSAKIKLLFKYSNNTKY